MENQKQIDRLRSIINDPNKADKVRQQAQTQLDRLTAIGGVQMASVQSGAVVDPTAQTILDAINNALNKGVTSATDIKREIEEVLRYRKINESDLSDSLRAYISSTKKIEITITQISGQKSKTTTPDKFLSLPLTQNLLSDMKARNNSYLYGGAGTGKTYSAEEIANMLDWQLITINCSQYTSPLDILGGQTIEGYVEGRLSQAWSNRVYDATGKLIPVEGCVLLLDELPKIDPNTAGLLNDALAKVKPNKIDSTTMLPIMPKIRNGKGEELELKNLFVIGTGNVALNTIDPDYEANFKQDLSLQDRFIGSMYKVKVDYEYELNDIMSGYAFIWIFLSKIRLAIKNNKASAQAFVSLRIMINAKETYRVFRDIELEKASGKMDMVTNPKTLKDTMDSFFDLFKPAQQEAIIKEVNYDEFLKIVEQKNTMPYFSSNDKTKSNDFNTPNEITEAQRLITLMKQEL